MAVNGKKLLKAVKEACAIFGISAAVVGAVLAVFHAVVYLELPGYVIPIAICVPALVAVVITTYRDQ